MSLLRTSLVVIVVLTAAELAHGQSFRADDRRMQGEWSLVNAERDRAVADDAPDGSTLVVRGSDYAIGSQPGGRRSWNTEAGRITLNGNRWPREIDLTVTSGPQAGSVYRGIYQLEGDTQRVNFAPPGHSRPTSFSAVPGSGQTSYLWRRGAPAQPQTTLAPIGTTPQFIYSRYPQSPSGYYGGGPYAFPWSPGW